MNKKEMIMVCLAVTALIAALDISDLLPNLVTAFLLIGGGCTAAYLMALNEQRHKTISALNFIIKADNLLNASTTQSTVLNRLQDLIMKLAGGAQIYFSPQMQSIETGNGVLDRKLIAAIDALVMERKKTFIWPNPDQGEMASLFEHGNVTELMAVPLQHQEEVMGIIYVYSDLTLNLQQHQPIVERLALCAAHAINQLRSCQIERDHDGAIIKSIINSIDRQQPFFAGHSERVAFSAGLMAARLNLTPEEATALKYGALLHDVGKMVSENGQETAWGMEHPVRGAAILPEDEFFIPIKEGILSHHERYDGQGYPQGVKHNEIPFLARIIAVADMYDALVRLCPEEDRLSHEQAVQTIKKATGTLFDPLVVVAFEEAEEEINRFYQDN